MSITKARNHLFTAAEQTQEAIDLLAEATLHLAHAAKEIDQMARAGQIEAEEAKDGQDQIEAVAMVLIRMGRMSDSIRDISI